MSIINQMLNDLDSRSVQGEVPNIPHVQPYPARDKESLLYQGIRWLLLMAVVSAVLWFLFPYLQKNNTGGAKGFVDQTAAMQPLQLSRQVSGTTDKAPPPDGTRQLVSNFPTEKTSLSHGQTQLSLSIEKSLEVSAIQQAEEVAVSAQGESHAGAVGKPVKIVALQREAPPQTKPEQADGSEIKIVQRASHSQMLARELLSDARRLIMDGAHTKAISLLKQALDVNGVLLEAREHLVTLMMQDDEPQQVAPWLDEGLDQAPDNELFIMARSRLQVMAGDYTAAINTLTRTIEAGLTGVDIRSTLAALYQQTGEFSVSAALYRQLLVADPSREIWWMGLAISLENTGEKKVALDAYRQAVYSGRLKSALADYARQRIAILNRI